MGASPVVVVEVAPSGNGCGNLLATHQPSPSTERIRKEIGDCDVVVDAVLWDVFRTDHIVDRDDLKRMRPRRLIIDISCDPAMASRAAGARRWRPPSTGSTRFH